jgi:hypothetical protein
LVAHIDLTSTQIKAGRLNPEAAKAPTSARAPALRRQATPMKRDAISSVNLQGPAILQLSGNITLSAVKAAAL